MATSGCPSHSFDTVATLPPCPPDSSCATCTLTRSPSEHPRHPCSSPRSPSVLRPPLPPPSLHRSYTTLGRTPCSTLRRRTAGCRAGCGERGEGVEGGEQCTECGTLTFPSPPAWPPRHPAPSVVARSAWR